MKKNRILCSAIWVDDGERYDNQPKNIKSGFVVCGRRHHNCIITISLIYKDVNDLISIRKQGKIIQGFLTDDDLFLNREQACDVAYEAVQILNDGELISSVLTSEDLW